VAGYVGCGRAIMKLNTTARLKDIRVPVLAITGEQDGAAAGTRYIGENVPGAKIRRHSAGSAHRQRRAAGGVQPRAAGVLHQPLTPRRPRSSSSWDCSSTSSRQRGSDG